MLTHPLVLYGLSSVVLAFISLHSQGHTCPVSSSSPQGEQAQECGGGADMTGENHTGRSAVLWNYCLCLSIYLSICVSR